MAQEEQESQLPDDTVMPMEMESDELVYTLIETGSQKGFRKLVSSDGYAFVFKREYKSGVIHWRCSVRAKGAGCPATIKQLGNEYCKGARQHNHPARPGLRTTVEVHNEIKTVGRSDLFESAPVLVKRVRDNHSQSDQPEAARTNEDYLSRICNRARQKLRPQEPSSIENLEIDEDYLQRSLGETFFRKTVVVKDRRHMIFATDQQLKVLESAKTWYVDATFKVVRTPFTQMFSVHAFIQSGEDIKQLPLCFVLMSGRKRRDYRKVIQALVRLLPSKNVTTVVTDFEAGIWQGVRDVLPDVTMRGCAFHFGQALWRKCVELGLKVAYERRDSVFKLLRKTFALPLLPHEDIRPALDNLKQKNEDETMSPYLAYVETTWLQSTVWSPENWSVYGRSIRTNNDVEGWHNRLNRRAKKGNLPFYLLVELLHGEAQEIKHQCKLVKERKLKRRQTRQTRTTQGRLWAVWERYGKKEISASELLSECGRLYGPVDR